MADTWTDRDTSAARLEWILAAGRDPSGRIPERGEPGYAAMVERLEGTWADRLRVALAP